jgi:hypothetical protein
VNVPAAGRQPAHWTVSGVYLVYLLPYVAVSYYERYTVPLLAVKVLFVLWAIGRLLSFGPVRRARDGRKPQTLASAAAM